MLEPVQSNRDSIQLSRNGCGFLMLAKLRQLEWAQGFVHLMYNLLEQLDRVIEFMLPSNSIACRNGQQLLPVRAMTPLMQMRAYQRRWTSRGFSRTGRTRYLNPPNRPSPRISFPQ